jgi:hypothetical protein
MKEGAVVIADPPKFDEHEKPTVRVARTLEARVRPPAEQVSLRVLPGSAARPTLSSMPPSYLAPASLALGSLDEVPYVALDPEALRARKLDPQTAFVLALVDGRMTIESVLDVCPLGTHRVLRILGALLGDGIIAMRSGSKPQR